MLRIQDQVLWVTGKIDFDNAEQCYQQGLQLIQSHSLPLTVDLSQLTYSSTVALAVLLRWLRQTPHAQGLKFQAVPEKMLKIMQSCHLQQDLQFV
jgi:phospholipid transport system transporter-binding protein